MAGAWQYLWSHYYLRRENIVYGAILFLFPQEIIVDGANCYCLRSKLLLTLATPPKSKDESHNQIETNAKSKDESHNQ